jgi:hypothetical protein
MATANPVYNPGLFTAIGPPAVIDGTGLTTTVPLTIKNGKNNSGIELWATGTAPTGYILADSAGTRVASFGYSVAANDWFTGAAAGDVSVLGPSVAAKALWLKAGGTGGVRIGSVSSTANLSNGWLEIVDATSAIGRGTNYFYCDSTSWNLLISSTIRMSGAAGGIAVNAFRFKAAQGASVAAASTLTLGLDGNFFSITGNTNVDYITTTNWQAGSEITLQFTGTPTVNHNTGSVPGSTAAVLLAGAANFSATANDMLTLVYNGTNWCEKARAVI